MTTYDREAAEQEAANYRTPSIVARRRLVRSLLDPDVGEAVLSVGCGPGFEPAELADTVGAGESVGGADTMVVGVDRSQAMLDLASERFDDGPSVDLLCGTATRLPVPPASFDAATAVQVYEYVEALDRALAELFRALRPGGRAVVVDTDWDSVVWHADDRERMARVLDAWEDVFARLHLGSRLAPYLRDAGFAVKRVEPNAIVNTSLDEDRFVSHLAAFVEERARVHDDLGPEVANEWAADLRAVERRGETFFSLMQYCYLVWKRAERAARP